MPLVAVVWFGLLGSVDGGSPAPDVAAAYEQARSASGRSPADQVRLALWCEAHGLTAERMRHLALAVLADPANATARGLAGLVARDGRWVAPDAVAQTVRRDEANTALLAQYDQKRAKTPYTADAQWALAQWADEQGLKDQSRAHYTAVTRLDPARELAWKRLGFKRHEGRWTTDAQIAAARAEADARKHADRTWKPLLEQWRGMLARADQREEARTALLGVTDPRALPAIARVFGTDRTTDQQVAVGLLGQIESPHAARLLAVLAVTSAAPDVRRTALETLRRRDPRDFIGFWISLIQQSVRYEVRPIGGPGLPGGLFIAGEKANTQRIYRPLDPPNLANFPLGSLSTDANGLPVLLVGRGSSVAGNVVLDERRMDVPRRSADLPLQSMIVRLDKTAAPAGQVRALKNLAASSMLSPTSIQKMTNTPGRAGQRILNGYVPVVESEVQIPIGQMIQEARASAVVAQAQLTNDVATLDAYNDTIRRANAPILLALGNLTGRDYGEDRERWGRWWINEQGYASVESSTTVTPTFVENVPIDFTPTAAPIQVSQVVGYARHSCFAAGTLVRTIDGTRRIEQVQRGDLVLVQDTLAGSLSYQPVLTAFHNPPSPTYRVQLGEDEVVATGIHRFWQAGKGWTMARDLKVGDSLRVLGGVATVATVTPDQVQPVFNLEVADGRSFFVGRLGALVHDNSLVEATPAPFDADRVVASAVRGGGAH